MRVAPTPETDTGISSLMKGLGQRYVQYVNAPTGARAPYSMAVSVRLDASIICVKCSLQPFRFPVCVTGPIRATVWHPELNSVTRWHDAGSMTVEAVVTPVLDGQRHVAVDTLYLCVLRAGYMPPV